MKISYIKRFYVQHCFTDCQVGFSSLTAAVRYAVSQKDTNLLVHIGFFNLDYYRNGDTFDTLYQRCVEIVKNINN